MPNLYGPLKLTIYIGCFFFRQHRFLFCKSIERSEWWFFRRWVHGQVDIAANNVSRRLISKNFLITFFDSCLGDHCINDKLGGSDIFIHTHLLKTWRIAPNSRYSRRVRQSSSDRIPRQILTRHTAAHPCQAKRICDASVAAATTAGTFGLLLSRTCHHAVSVLYDSARSPFLCSSGLPEFTVQIRW